MTDPRRPALASPLTAGLLLIMLSVAFEAMAVTTAMPVAAADLDGIPLYAWVFSLFTIGMMTATVVAGRLADRSGPLVPLALGGTAFTLGLVMAGLAPTMPVLLAARLVQGIGAGALNLGIVVVVAHAFDARQRAALMTWTSSAWVLPSFVGPPAAAWLTAHLSWHWVFWAVLPLTLVGLAASARPLIGFRRLLVPTEHEPDPVPVWAAVVVAAATAAVQLGGQVLGGTGAAAAALGVVGILAAGPFLMPRGFVRFGAGLPPVIVTRALLAGAFLGAESFFPLMMVQLAGWSLFRAGITLAVGSVGWLLGAWAQSQPWLRLRRDQIIRLGALLVVAGLAAITAFPWLDPRPVWLVLLGWILAGTGMGLASSSTLLATITLSGAHEQGRNSSSLQVGEALGNSLLLGLAGTLFATLHPRGDVPAAFGWLLVAMTGAAGLAGLVATRSGEIHDR